MVIVVSIVFYSFVVITFKFFSLINNKDQLALSYFVEYFKKDKITLELSTNPIQGAYPTGFFLFYNYNNKLYQLNLKTLTMDHMI